MEVSCSFFNQFPMVIHMYGPLVYCKINFGIHSLSLFILISSMMTMVVSSLMWSAGLLLVLAVSHVRLQCNSRSTFEAHCSGVIRRSCKF